MRFSIAAGVFEESLRARLDGLATSSSVLDVHDDPIHVDPEKILILCGQRPLFALREAGLATIEMPSPDPGEIR